MTETPDPEKQNQKQPTEAANQAPASPADAPGGQNGSAPPAMEETAQDGIDKLTPAGEQDDSDLDEREKPQQAGPDQEEAIRRKERLEKQASWQAEFSSEQERASNQRAHQRRAEFDRRQIGLRRIEESDLLQNEQLFVPPEGYQKFVERIEQSTGTHILIVTGPEHSGKLTTAIYLAHHLWPKKAPDIFLFADLSIKTLLNVVADEQLPSNAVILFDEVFNRKQLMVDDLVNRYTHLKEDLINRGNVWFLFTVLPGPDLDALAASNFPILNTSTVDRDQVLEKLIDFFFPEAFGNQHQRTMLLEARAELNHDLTPPDLYNLFDLYRQNVPQLCKELTKRLTKEEKEEQERLLAPDRWFQDLPSMNYQLYALLVVLFEKLDIPILEEIYTEAVNALRQQGMDSPEEFIDPRRISTSLMHQSLGIQERFQVLEFRHRSYRQYVEEQVGNFQRLLWSLIDANDPSTFSLVSLIHELSEYDFRAIREGRYSVPNEQLSQLRYAIAAMIAQVGVYHLNKLGQLLDKFVSDESPLVALTATFVLAELAQRDKFDFVETLLKAWSKSERFEQMWVAAASISVIYTAIANPLEDQTEEDEPDEQDEQEKEEDEQEKKKETTREQKSSGKGRLAKLRELLTELVQVHTQFSKEVINERRSQLNAMYRTRLRQYLAADLEPLPDKERLFRDLSESEQDEYFNAVYEESKKSIYEAIQGDIALLLVSWVDQMRMVLMQTLGNIAQAWPRDVTRLVRVWLDRKDTESLRWQIGHMALNYLFRESSTIKDASRLQQSAYPLLDLLPLAMRTHKLTMELVLHDVNLLLQFDAFRETGTLGQHLEVGDLLRGDPLIFALSAIQRWYEHVSELAKRQEPKKEKIKAAPENEEEDEKEPADEVMESVLQKRWQEAVYAVLSNSMNSAPQEERQRLRWALFLWIKSGEQMLCHIARILISHSYVMDGVVLDLPSSKRAGIVVLDNTRKDQEDREHIFYLLQRLSSIAPLRLHWLGYTRDSRLLSSEDRKETGQIPNARKILSLDSDDLLLRGASRPALLLPVLVSGQGQGYLPELSYFVAVFHNGPILDLDDFYPGRVDPSAQPVSANIFGDLLRNRKAASSTHRQPWQGKLYLLPSSEKFVVDAALSPFLKVVYPENFGLIEEELHQQVTLTLRQCSAEELWQDLRNSIGVPETQPRTFERLAGEIELWLKQLADTSKLYPDVSLFILWTIMVRSRENLAEALQLIELLLTEKPEGEEDKAAKKVRKLRQQMGIACARMLFHFYGTSNPGLSSTEYGSLLRLLPQIIACASSYTEILPILSVLFQLAWTNDWLQLLNEQDGALFECISKVATRDLKPLRNWLTYHQYWLAMIRLFLEYDKPFNEFRAFGETVFQRYKVPQPKQSRRAASNKVDTAPGEQASKFLAILPAADSQDEKDRYDWALQQIAFQETRLRNPDARTEILTGLQNLEILLAHLTSELQIRLDGAIERLKEGQAYGVVLVEAQNKAAAHQAFLFVQEFVKQRKESKRQHLTLMIQRLGEKEVLAKVRNNRKLKNEREISDKRKLPQVIGPLLERYPADQVAFVLIITADPIIDYDDWAEQEQWVSRLWVSRLGKWHPYHGKIADLKEGMQLTLETLFNRPEGEKDSYDYVSLLPDHAGTIAN